MLLIGYVVECTEWEKDIDIKLCSDVEGGAIHVVIGTPMEVCNSVATRAYGTFEDDVFHSHSEILPADGDGIYISE